MRKIEAHGSKIKELRQQLDKGSTQKEFAYAVGVSERTLRDIENRNEAVSAATLDRMSVALGVDSHLIAAPTERETEGSMPVRGAITEWDDVLVSRFDEELAETTMDAGKVFSEASKANDVECAISTELNAETEVYAIELFGILKSLSRSQRRVRSVWDANEPTNEIDVRRRLRQLLVLLKGNDVWVYQNTVFRRLPERFSVPDDDETHETQIRFYVTLGRPGEYGETTLLVAIDHGQPFILKTFRPRRRSM